MRITEAQMFKVVVVVGLAMVPVVLLAALVSPAAGAGLLLVEAIYATYWLVRRWRAVRPFGARTKGPAAAESAPAPAPQQATSDD